MEKPKIDYKLRVLDMVLEGWPLDKIVSYGILLDNFAIINYATKLRTLAQQNLSVNLADW